MEDTLSSFGFPASSHSRRPCDPLKTLIQRSESGKVSPFISRAFSASSVDEKMTNAAPDARPSAPMGSSTFSTLPQAAIQLDTEPSSTDQGRPFKYTVLSTS